MHPIRRSFALVAAVLLPVASLAQVPSRTPDSQEPIPRELVVALLNLGQGNAGTVDIRVGKAPDDVPPELIPPGLQLLGSSMLFGNSIIVLAAPQAPDSAIAAIEARLLSGGWTKPSMPEQVRPRGFVPADAAMAGYDRPDILCRGDDMVMMSGTYRRSGGSIVRLAHNRGQNFSACRRPDARQFRNPYEDAPIPTLRAPQGAVSKSGGDMSSSSSPSGSIGYSMSTRLGTKSKPVEIVAHYDKQLREQGWTSISDGAIELLAARSYRRNDEKGQTWTALLMSMVMPETSDQDVVLRLSRK